VKAGYEYVKDKFELGGLTPIPSETVKPPRIEGMSNSDRGESCSFTQAWQRVVG